MSGAARLIARKEHPESEQQGWSMLRTHDGMAKIHAQRQPVHKTSVVAEAFEAHAGLKNDSKKAWSGAFATSLFSDQDMPNSPSLEEQRRVKRVPGPAATERSPKIVPEPLSPTWAPTGWESVQSSPPAMELPCSTDEARSSGDAGRAIAALTQQLEHTRRRAERAEMRADTAEKQRDAALQELDVERRDRIKATTDAAVAQALLAQARELVLKP